MAGKKEKVRLDTTAAKRALQEIALREGTSVKNVRQHIQVSIMSALLSNDPKVKAFWEQLPHQGEIPTPEDVIIYLATELYQKRDER